MAGPPANHGLQCAIAYLPEKLKAPYGDRKASRRIICGSTYLPLTCNEEEREPMSFSILPGTGDALYENHPIQT
jgi:hypothetical protein